MRIAVLVLLPALLLPAAAQERAEVTDKQVRAIDRGTKWLLKAQNKDGSWGLDTGNPGDVTCTSLAALAMMAAGNTEKNGPDSASVDAVRAATEWVFNRARKAKNDIVAGEVTLIQNKLGAKVHNFFAVVFLTQIYGMRPVWLGAAALEEMREILSNLVNIIAQSQEPDGSWHKETFGSLKATCMAWLALRSASSAGIEIRKAAVDRTVAFIKKQYNSGTRLFDKSGQGGYQAIYATASSLRVLQGMGLGKSEECLGAAEAFLKFVKGPMGAQFLTVEGEDFLSAAMMSHALVHEEGERWAAWFPFIRDQLVKRQNSDGSWVSTACITGRTFPTACSLLTLETPYRLLPLQEQ